MIRNNLPKTIVSLLLLAASTSVFAQEKKNKSDTTHQTPSKNLKSREVTTEFPCNADATIFLENILRQVNIKTTNEKKVKLSITVYYEGKDEFTNEEWLRMMEVEVGGNAGKVVVKSENLGKKNIGTLPPKRANINRILTLYVPAAARLNIESKYGDITIDNNIKELKARISNGGLTVKDVEKLNVISTYGRIHADNILSAEVDITNGNFSSKQCTMLTINSRNSTVESGSIKQLNIHSETDEYEIEEAGEISGTKNHGNLRITTLTKSLDIKGLNASIKLRSIEQGVSLIKIDDQYADLRLPVDNLKDYTVSFEGTDVVVFAPFEKANATDTSFKTIVGSGKTTSFQVKCTKCTVDFK
jgi:hypothetical protein